ncbi:MAG: ExbD/TolR family protein [Burkholderiales bacterium]|jgi:biopolymer transport protein TolR
MTFGRLQRNTGSAPLHEINMTPLIDVMLVLLVIFMISAPLMTSRLKLELPQVDAPSADEQPQFMSVALDAQGRFFLNDVPLDDVQLFEQLTMAAKKNPQIEVQLRADKSIAYGRVAELMAALQKAGLTRIGFVIEPVVAPSAATPTVP